ncbi:MAG: DUF2764 family protein [Cecembia sp.]
MNYYYLIASLPDISPEMDPSKLDFEEIFDLIYRNLSEEDKALFRYLIYPNDIDNLLSILSEKHLDWTMGGFKKPAIFQEEELKGYKLNKGNFPDFMNDFLTDNEDRFAGMSLREMEDGLGDRFYNEVFGLENKFLISYYAFLRGLRALIAAFHYNTYDFLSQPKIQDADRLLLQVGPDRSPAAMVTKDYPYLEELIKVLSENQPKKTERFIDKVQWDFLESQSEGAFSPSQVFAYTAKLQILQRWLKIDSKKDSKYFEKLQHQIINQSRPSKIPTI